MVNSTLQKYFKINHRHPNSQDVLVFGVFATHTLILSNQTVLGITWLQRTDTYWN